MIIATIIMSLALPALLQLSYSTGGEVQYNFLLMTPDPARSGSLLSCFYTYVAFHEQKDHFLLTKREKTILYYWENSTNCSMQGIMLSDVAGARDTSKRLYSRIMFDSTPRIGLDSFLPIPHRLLGTCYTVLTGAVGEHQLSYIALVNVNWMKFIRVTVLLKSTTLKPSDIKLDEGTFSFPDNISIDVNFSTRAYLTSLEKDMDGVHLIGLQRFAVLAGISSQATVASSSVVHNLEMFLPFCFWGLTYFVPFHETFQQAYIAIRPSLCMGSMTVVVYHNRPVPEKNYFKDKMSIPYIQQNSGIKIQAMEPIIVVQFLHRGPELSSVTAMTLVPPLSRWVASAVVFPLLDSDQDEQQHFALIIIETSAFPGLSVLDLENGTDAKDSLTIVDMARLKYTQAYLELISNNNVLLQHATDTFQVIQYGISGKRVAYASLVAFRLENCEATIKCKQMTTSDLCHLDLPELVHKEKALELSTNHVTAIVTVWVLALAFAASILVVLGYMISKSSKNEIEKYAQGERKNDKENAKVSPTIVFSEQVALKDSVFETKSVTNYNIMESDLSRLSENPIVHHTEII